MKVQILSTSDGQGGAAKAAFRLNGALRAAGVDCVLSTLQPTVGAKGVVAFPLGGGFAGGLERVVGKIRSKLFDRRLRRSRPPGSEIYSIDRTPYAGDFARWRPEYDLINLHWVGRFVDIAAFFSHHPDQPVAWTLHDMNPFTGGCHYDSGCGRFTQGCGRCPELGSGREDDLSAAVFRRKKTVFDALPEGRLHLVTPSRWLAGEAGRSALFERFPVTVIPNGIDTGLFAPADRDRQRRELGIAADAKVVLFAAQAVDAPRKGFLLLVQALGKIDAATSEGLLLLSVGGDTPDLGGAGINHRHLGFMNDENAMNAVYGAADLLALPSLQDNLPNTMIEALACGTPCVSFDVGGITDFVRPGETGFLAPAGDAEAFASAIEDAFSDQQRLKGMSANCRNLAVGECSLAVQAGRYRVLFETLTGNG